MKRSLGWGLLIGLLLTVPLIALMYLADQLVNLPFVPFNLFDWTTRMLPGDLITFGIDTMISGLLLLGGTSAVGNAKAAEQMSAVLAFLTAGTLAVVVYFLVLSWRRLRPSLLSGVILGALVGLPLIMISTTVTDLSPLITFVWLLLIFLGWGVAASWAAAHVLESEDVSEVRSVQQVSRRQFLIRLGSGAAAITVVSTGVGVMLSRRAAEEATAAVTANSHAAPESDSVSFPNSNDPVVPAPGTRPEYTPLKDHYKVFLRTEPSLIDESAWMLPITGMVDKPKMLKLSEIREQYPSRDQYVTLSCISGRIGTSLISTTQWSGVSAQDLLADLGIQEGARYLDITCDDGFHESVALDLIDQDERIMFCYDWDGQPLPKDHGFPLRIWIPDVYGMKQPKWITGINVTDEYREGYWVERNWSETAQVKVTSVIDTVALDAIYENNGQQMVPVGGIAWAGDRQISKVELRVDDGAWQEAQLRQPLSETTWVIWRYEWPFVAGNHTFEVRCYDGNGELQIVESSDQRPDGATGIHSYDI
ncbi:MAG: molybdopterin-dependent oxidoreductase [Anaerolineae bacterium]|nr:molybdopterin-dependent oxidoreductase [Anaerolineae bacterium]